MRRPKNSPQTWRWKAARREEGRDAENILLIYSLLLKGKPVKQAYLRWSYSYEYEVEAASSQSLHVAQADEIRPQYLDPDSVTGAAIFQANITRDIGPTLGSNIDAIDQQSFSSVGALSELASPWYSDQILPFDITLAA